MKRMILTVFTCLLLAYAHASAIDVGDQAIEIKAKDWFNSEPLTLAALKDKIVVVEFWATWCPPCRQSVPHIVELHEKYKDKGVVIIGLTGEAKTEIKKFVGDMKMTYAIGTDSETSQTYGVRGIPHAFVISPGGKIFWHDHPMAGLSEAIEDALKKTPPVMVKPEDKARGEKLLGEADGLIGQKQYAQALAKLKEASQIKGVFDAKVTAAKKAEDLEKQAAAALEEAVKKPNLEAYEAVKNILKDYEGSVVSAKAKTELDRLAQTEEVRTAAIENKFAKESAEMLEHADGLYKQKDYAKALGLYDRVAKDYPATDAGKQAAKKAQELRADKALMEKVTSTETTKAASSLLRMAKSYIANNDPLAAKEKLETLVKDYPQTPEAGEGRKLLGELK